MEQYPPPPNPYAPPASSGAGFGPPPPPMYPYTPGGAVAVAAIVMLVVTMLLDLVSIAIWVQVYGLMSDADAGRAVSESSAETADLRVQLTAVSQVALRLLTAIPFCIYFHRMHRNLPSLGAAGLTYTPGWAAGGFFVPILNLFRPYQVGAEIWDASNPQADPANPYHWQMLRAAPIIGIWWGLFLAPGIMERLVGQRLLDSKDPGTYMKGVMVSIVVDVISIVGAAFTIHLIRRIDRRQAERFRLLQQHHQQYGQHTDWPPPPTQPSVPA